MVTNIAEFCVAICKGDKSAALNLALTLSTTYNLDAATISEVNNYINTGVYTDTGGLLLLLLLCVDNIVVYSPTAQDRTPSCQQWGRCH